MSSNRKYFLNSSTSAVDDNLKGFVQSNPHLLLADEERIVIRRDFVEGKHEGRVSLLSGGGSGHEPSHAGFVGRGMLTAAVLGDIFASPPVSHILTALRTITSPAGTIVIVKNYTGDRLNFGLAVDRFKSEIVGGATITNVAIVLVEDDCATKDSAVGSRGLCGTVLMHKILGAMAEAGRSFQEIIEMAARISSQISTLAASLGHCSIPAERDDVTAVESDTRSPLFEDGHLKYELGLGIHNEPGVAMRLLEAVEKIVELLLRTAMRKLDRSEPSDGFLVVINNLGGLSQLEMNIVCKEVISWFELKKLKITGLVLGTLMTSLNMPGFSITLLQSTDDIFSFLNCPTECSSWPGVSHINQDISFTPMAKLSVATSEVEGFDGEFLSEAQARMIRSALMAACEAISSAETHLNYLDSITGDGDCGTTMAKLATRFAQTSGTLDFGRPRNFFRQLALLASDFIGGTTGALYGILFTGLSSGLAGKNSRDPAVWLSAFQSTLDNFMKFSRAQSGDKSMLDALLAIQEGLEFFDLSAQLDAIAIADALRATAEKCQIAAEATKMMVASVGRATYSRERPDLTKVPDAGAVAVSCWFTAVAAEVAAKNSITKD